MWACISYVLVVASGGAEGNDTPLAGMASEAVSHRGEVWWCGSL